MIGHMFFDQSISYFAETNYRNNRHIFGIRQSDRRYHMYIVGKTGTGKSTLLETLIHQDIEANRGLAFLDPHGDMVEWLASQITNRTNHIYLNAPDPKQPYGFNPLAGIPPGKHALATSGILSAFKKLWSDFWGPRLEHLLRNALLALMAHPFSTLADILRLFDDPKYRKAIATGVSNPLVRRFWLHEFEGYPVRLQREAAMPVQNKVGAFLADPIMRRLLTAPEQTLDFRDVLDTGRILLVNLAKGKLGEDTSALLGSLLVTMLGVAGLSRADIPEGDRQDFFVYLDEFQAYPTHALAGMLSELRKYRTNLILSTQYLKHVPEPVRYAILGNVGTMISFRVGVDDAEILEKEFRPVFGLEDLVNLPNYSIYLKMMIDGRVSKPFSADTVRPHSLGSSKSHYA